VGYCERGVRRVVTTCSDPGRCGWEAVAGGAAASLTSWSGQRHEFGTQGVKRYSGSHLSRGSGVGSACQPRCSRQMGIKAGLRAACALLQVAAVVAAAAVIVVLGDRSSAASLAPPLRRALQHAARALYALPPLLPLAWAPQSPWRAVLLAFLPPYLLLSLSWEPAFYAAMTAALGAWLRAEHCYALTGGHASRCAAAQNACSTTCAAACPGAAAAADATTGQSLASTTTTDVAGSRMPAAGSGGAPTERRGSGSECSADRALWREGGTAVTFLNLALLSFFGQGNAATIASFDIGSVFRLTTVFDPFVMALLLVSKQLAPMFLVVVAFRLVAVQARRSVFSSYVAVLIASDVVSLALFFGVKGTGSWADIGSRLGYYGIVNAQVVLMLLLLALSALYCPTALSGGAVQAGRQAATAEVKT
jgi:hypothetical protein